MKWSIRSGFIALILMAALMSLMLMQPGSRATAQGYVDGTAGSETAVPVAARLHATGQVRTPQQVLAAEADGSRAPGVSGQIPFRPTMDAAAYGAAKQAAARAPASSKPAPPAAGPLGPPTVIVQNVEGVNASQQTSLSGFNLRPPDNHGAIGATQYVEVVNSAIRIFNRTNPGTTLQLSASLASFFGYFTQIIFDPRVVYDPVWNRWVVYAEAFAESATVQRLFIATSTTSNATGPYCIYNFDINFLDNDDFWDYGQLGMDQDAIHLTANIFGTSTFKGARLITLAKARIYNCLGVSIPVFSGLVGTLAATNVIGQNVNTFLVAAPTSGTTVTKYTLRNASQPNGVTLASSSITVPSYAVPPDATQPGTSIKLDTLDSRFVNASTQVGTSLFQAHTIALSVFPAPKFYEFNTSTNTIVQQGFFFKSSSSHDWNASIAANSSKDVFVTWSATEPAGTNAQVRFSGRRAADTIGVIGAGSALFTSAGPYTGFGLNPERWGDYSAVQVDPLNSLSAWLVNQKNNGTTVWGTRIGQVGY